MQIHRLFLVGGLMTLLGCSDTTRPANLAVSITPSAPTIRAGDTLRINVTVVNIGDHTTSVSAKACPAPFQVFDIDGDDVSPPRGPCTTELANALLEPGSSFTYALYWTGERLLENGGRTPLPQGSYMLRGQVLGESGVISAGLAQVYIIP